MKLKKTKLDADVGMASEHANKTVTPVIELQAEITTAETMIKHLNEYNRMKTMQTELETLTSASESLNR